jgi:hypothetical protein
MNMPRFTAEASFYKESRHYHTVGSFSQADGAIHLSVFSSAVPPEWGPCCVRVETCYRDGGWQMLNIDPRYCPGGPGSGVCVGGLWNNWCIRANGI